MKNEARPRAGRVLLMWGWAMGGLGACGVASPAGGESEAVAHVLPPLEVSASRRVEETTSAAVLDGGFLAEFGVEGHEDLSWFVPGLVAQEQSPATPSLNIRGITTDSGDPRGETRVAVFQDGVSIGRMRGAAVEFFDLERVEVLKGPQGTLFGRGAEIGAIAITQAKAGERTEAELATRAGERGERGAEGMLNVPLVQGEWAARVAFRVSQRDGYTENLAGGPALNGRDTAAARLALRWTPGDGATSVDLLLNHQRDRPPATGVKSMVIPTSAGDTDAFGATELNRADELRVDRRVSGATLLAERKLAEGWTLRSVGGLRGFDSFEDYDGDGSRLHLLEFSEDARGRQASQELRLHYDDDGPLAAFVGVGWFRETGSQRIDALADDRALWPLFSDDFRDGLVAAGVPGALAGTAVPAMNPVSPQAALPAEFAFFNSPFLPPSLRALSALAGAPLAGPTTESYINDARTEAFDLVLDGTWRASGRWSFTAGLRLVTERVRSGYEVIDRDEASALGAVLGASPNGLFAPTDGRREAEGRFDSWDGRAGVAYAFASGLSGYVAISRGHRPTSLLVDEDSVTELREESVVHGELGLRGEARALPLAWHAAVFRYRYRHFQTSVVDPANPARFVPLDAGNATGRGFEFSVRARPDARLMCFASYAFTDVVFDGFDDEGRPQQYAGDTPRLSPRHALTLGATAELARGRRGAVFVSPVFHYTSERWFDDDNDAYGGRLRQGGYGLVNLSVGWRSTGGDWSAVVVATNLLDREYLADAGNIGGAFGLPTTLAGAPRQLSAVVTRRW